MSRSGFMLGMYWTAGYIVYECIVQSQKMEKRKQNALHKPIKFAPRSELSRPKEWNGCEIKCIELQKCEKANQVSQFFKEQNKLFKAKR